MFPKKISQNIDILTRLYGNMFHGNQVSWGINYFFISLYSEHQPHSFICSSLMLAPIISSLDEIYFTTLEKSIPTPRQFLDYFTMNWPKHLTESDRLLDDVFTLQMIQVFSRVHATLQPTLSICLPVRRSHLAFVSFFSSFYSILSYFKLFQDIYI